MILRTLDYTKSGAELRTAINENLRAYVEELQGIEDIDALGKEEMELIAAHTENEGRLAKVRFDLVSAGKDTAFNGMLKLMETKGKVRYGEVATMLAIHSTVSDIAEGKTSVIDFNMFDNIIRMMNAWEYCTPEEWSAATDINVYTMNYAVPYNDAVETRNYIDAARKSLIERAKALQGIE